MFPIKDISYKTCKNENLNKQLLMYLILHL